MDRLRRWKSILTTDLGFVWALLQEHHRFALPAVAWFLLVWLVYGAVGGPAVAWGGWSRGDLLTFAEVGAAISGAGAVGIALLGVARTYSVPQPELLLSLVRSPYGTIDDPLGTQSGLRIRVSNASGAGPARGLQLSIGVREREGEGFKRLPDPAESWENVVERRLCSSPDQPPWSYGVYYLPHALEKGDAARLDLDVIGLIDVTVELESNNHALLGGVSNAVTEWTENETHGKSLEASVIFDIVMAEFADASDLPPT